MSATSGLGAWAPGLHAGKVALVTGASRGLGQAIAIQLASQGARVAFTYRTFTAGAEETLAAIADVGGEGAALATDIRVENEVKALFKAVDKQFGPADIVVNNAGILRDAMTVLLTAADWNDVLITNLTGTFLVCKAALSRMSRRRSGSIVNIGSVIGTMGGLGQANYSASKAALVGLTKSLAREGAKRGVRVNLVVPGAIATAMTAHLVAGHAGGAAAESIIPLQRLGRPADVAHLVSFVASELGSYMTGTMLTVDGGLSM